MTIDRERLLEEAGRAFNQQEARWTGEYVHRDDAAVIAADLAAEMMEQARRDALREAADDMKAEAEQTQANADTSRPYNESTAWMLDNVAMTLLSWSKQIRARAEEKE